MSETKNITRSNSKSVNSGRDTSRKGRDGDKKNEKDGAKDNLSLVIKLESDVKRLKCDLQLSRNRENELRDQIVSYMSSKLNTVGLQKTQRFEIHYTMSGTSFNISQH